jgi:hypothetical protein
MRAILANNIWHVRARETARGHRYLYLVESVRDGGRVRQQIVRALGRKDALLASGELDRLVASLARHSEQAMILSDMEAGQLSCTRIGGPLPSAGCSSAGASVIWLTDMPLPGA